MLRSCRHGLKETCENGDIANWATSENDTAPAVGGAMDLAVGAKRLWAVMEHTTKEGRPRLVRGSKQRIANRGTSRARSKPQCCNYGSDATTHR